MKQIRCDGFKFTRDKTTGYYLCTRKIGNKRPRLHVYVWEKANGPTPFGFDVHHIDENKENNALENLMLIPGKDHRSLHLSERMSNPELYAEQVNRLDKIREKASAWHKSSAGKEWHKLHYSMMGEVMHKKRKTECVQCGKIFETKGHVTKFCSVSCRNKWHYYGDQDKEQRICVVCGKEFSANKWRDNKTCNRSCATKLAHRSRALAIE